jgi:hypothetical protein
MCRKPNKKIYYLLLLFWSTPCDQTVLRTASLLIWILPILPKKLMLRIFPSLYCSIHRFVQVCSCIFCSEIYNMHTVNVFTRAYTHKYLDSSYQFVQFFSFTVLYMYTYTAHICSTVILHRCT